MILVDTSVWIDFFGGVPSAAPLADLLEAGEVTLHPWILGELTLGGLGERRPGALDDLRVLPRAAVLPDDEVLAMVGARRLVGSGVGWVDAHLLGSTLASGAGLWTRDRRLAREAARLGCRAEPPRG